MLTPEQSCVRRGNLTQPVLLGDSTLLLSQRNHSPRTARRTPAHFLIRGNWRREVTDLPRAVLGRGLPTLLHELPPAPGPLGELLRIRLLDARPLMQAVHEVAAQAVAIVDSLHGPLVVADLGDRSKHAGRLGAPGSSPPARPSGSRTA